MVWQAQSVYKNLTLQIQLQGVQGIQKNMLSGGYATDMFGWRTEYGGKLYS